MEYLVIGFLMLIGSIFLTRWIFRIDEQIRNQKVLIDMVGQLLLKSGLSVEEVRKLIKRNK